MAETRETVMMDITLLTKFAAAQRMKDKSAFSRSRVSADISAIQNLRHPAMPVLSRGLFDSNFDPRTSKGKQRSDKLLDAFATIFAGSGSCVAVGIIRDWENKVVHMIIGGNGTISEGQQQQIKDLYKGLKEIATASESITDRQFLPKHSNVLEDSPPARRYNADSHKLNRSLLRVPIINLLPNPARFTIDYISVPKLILDLVCRIRDRAFQAMVIRHCLTKIVKRCNKYGKLFNRIGDYLTQKDQKLSGIETYLLTFQELNYALEEMLVNPARTQDGKLMDFVLDGFQSLYSARSEINYQALNGVLLDLNRLVLQDSAQNRVCLRLSRSFQKLLVTTDSANELSKMARSPNLRSFFLDFEFEPVYLPEEHGTAPPTEIAHWMRRFQAMLIMGSNPSESEHGNKTKKILMECIEEAIGTKASCQIHAEVKVLGYLQGHGLVDKAINSVGINKLCCPACMEYINAMDIAIRVGRTHNKWYPWHLSPHNQFLSLDQLKEMRSSVLTLFNADWSTHLSNRRERSKSFSNQLDSSSGHFDQEELEYDWDKKNILQGKGRKRCRDFKSSGVSWRDV